MNVATLPPLKMRRRCRTMHWHRSGEMMCRRKNIYPMRCRPRRLALFMSGSALILHSLTRSPDRIYTAFPAALRAPLRHAEGAYAPLAVRHDKTDRRFAAAAE